MNTSLYISNGALHTYQRKLDTVSHNIANVGTVGYKKRESTFSENLANQMNNQIVQEQEIGRKTPPGIRLGQGVHFGQTALNMEQGSAKETGNPLDFMIEGKGFFRVSAAGADKDGVAEVRFTRDGSFKLSPAPYGGSFYLVTAKGDYLLDEQGDPIEIDEGYDVKIAENGEILLEDKNNPTDNFSYWQRVGVVDIANTQLLRNVGDNQFALREDVLAQGETAERWVRPMDMDVAGASKLRQGFLETSNVDLTKEMSELMISQRGFQMNSRAVSFADQMMGITNGIINR